ncbi:MAG: protein arginine kinase [Firmicutes bacterium]|nr:protein arginine kinase [Bacillota bacterium]
MNTEGGKISVGRWMQEVGPEGDVALSSRVRLARNLEHLPFPNRAADDQLRQIQGQVDRATRQQPIPELAQVRSIDLSDYPALEREVLVERHLISPLLAQHPLYRSVILQPDETLSVMVNEEDHVRIQAIVSGLNLEEALGIAQRVDDFYAQRLDIAFSSELGFITACPTNLGTGLRASVMLHLPGLVMTGAIRQAVEAASQMHLAVRGLYGEGSNALGNIFQISNQITLGRTEKDIVRSLEVATRQLVGQERAARQALLNQAQTALDDRVNRAYGLLRFAKAISSEEAMRLLSDVWLGMDLGLLPASDKAAWRSLLIIIRPATLQKLAGRELEPAERDRFRAGIIREQLARNG